jgi:hypothetical protein
MERSLKEIEMDIMIEEALIENEFRTEFNKKWGTWAEDYRKLPIWTRLMNEIKFSIRIRLTNIRAWIAVFLG